MAIWGEFTVDEETGAGASPSSGCTSDQDCDAEANEGCDEGRCAIRCLKDDACPQYSECWAGSYCTEPIGAPCDPTETDDCGGYLCRDRDITAKPVEPYCPGLCSVEKPCPDGYACEQSSCYKMGQ